MKALVTGATGFIGSHLVEVLTDNNWDVRILVRETSNLSDLDGHNCEKAIGDVRDSESLAKAVKGVDTVFHVAALVGEWGAWKDFYDINVTGMKNIIDASAAADVRRFIDVSSIAVHGSDGFFNSTEDNPYVKCGVFYNDSKVEAEKLVWEAHAEGRINASTIRPAMVWGPRDRAFMPKVIMACQSRKFVYPDGGEHCIGLSHVRNICDAIIRCTTVPEASGKAFIITDDCGTTLRQMVEKLCDELDIKRPSMSLPVGLLKGAGAMMESTYRKFNAKNPPLLTRMGVNCIGTSFSFDIKRAKKVLGYKPIYQFPQGLPQFLDWFRKEYNFSA